MAVGKGNHFDVLARVYFPHSLGMLYTAITQYLGFMGYGDEFKIMGLAPYGEPEFVRAAAQAREAEAGRALRARSLEYFRHWNEGVSMEWSDGEPNLGRVYSPALEKLLGPSRDTHAPLTKRDENLARSLQAVFEECAFHVLNGLWERTKNPRLCMAGGCAMNSVANGKVRANTPFRSIYIQPASGDNGTALGAAYYVWNQVMGKPRSFVMEHGYWGTSYPDGAMSSPIVDARADAEWTYDG